LVVWWFGGLVVWWFGGLVVWWFGGLQAKEIFDDPLPYRARFLRVELGGVEIILL
jgi:hypothetical protein